MFKAIKYALIICLGISFNALAVSGPFQEERFLKNNMGKVDHLTPLMIPNEALSDVQNVTMDDRGEYSKRFGYTVIGSTKSLGPSSWTVTGIGYHQAAEGESFYGIQVGSDVYRLEASLTTYTKVTGSSVTITNDPFNVAQTASLNDDLMFCNADDPPYFINSSSGAAVLADTTSVITGAQSCQAYSNYMVIANESEQDTQYPDRVRWSDLNNISLWPVLNYIDVEPDSGDDIVGMISYEDSIYIFKHHSVFRMLVTGSDGPDAFIINPVVRNIGAYAKNSIRVIPGVGIIFLSQNTVYTLNGSYAAQYSEKGLTPVGDPIQNTLRTIQRAQLDYAVGEVFPKHYQYWLSVSTGGASGLDNGLVLVYDWIQNNWTTYTDINAASMAAGDDGNGNSVLLTGDNHATVYDQDQGTVDNPVGVQTNIAFSLTTGDITLQQPEFTKDFKYLYLWTDTFSTGAVTVNAAYDLAPTYEFSQTVSPSALTPLYDAPTSLYNVSVFPGTGYNVYRMELDREARLIRLNFTNDDSFSQKGVVVGWALVYALEDLRE